MKNPVTVKLPDERRVTCNGEALCLPAGTVLAGELVLEPSDGPWGIREYEQPHYLTATFDFAFESRYLRYSGLVTQWNLWAPTGTQVETERGEFVDQVGRIDGMMDDREDWSYVLPDGRTHRNRLKYTSCHFWVMAKPTSLLVKCQYYEQNPDLAGMVTIFYSRYLEELLLLRDTRVFYDSRGKAEDFNIHGGDTITLKLRGEPSAGGDEKPAPQP
jgi:hypothetical protein